MSWSFSVKEKTPKDALESFKDQVHANSAHIPRKIAPNITNAADWLIDKVDDSRSVSLSSSGHFNADGSGSAHVQIIVSPPMLNAETPADQADTNDA
jgi:hypothetical protein